jgi:hypothetical protein
MHDQGTAQGGSTSTREALQDQAQQVTEKAREAQATVQDSVRDQVDSRSTQAGDQLASVSEAMRSMGDQLRSQGNDLPAQLAQQAAERAERLAGYLRDADADRIIGDIEDFGRRQPWVMAAAGLAVGVAAARFLKASSRRRYQSGSNGRSSLAGGYQSSTTYGSTGYGTPVQGSYPTEPVEVSSRVNLREGGTFPLEGSE